MQHLNVILIKKSQGPGQGYFNRSCENCYNVFSSKIDSLLKNIHGSNRHVGRISKFIENSNNLGDFKPVEKKIKTNKTERASKIEELKEKGFAKESEGALVFDVSEETDKSPVPPLLLLKSDGAALYGTTDLATVVERVRDMKADEIIYLADKRQGLHYEQFFRAAKKSGIAHEDTILDFIGFGTMNGKDGKPFKTREGGVMRLADLISMIKEAGKEKLKDNKNIAEEDVEEISSKVGLAALKYGDLSNQAAKDYVFDIDRFASFEGNTGPYILYTIVRIKSILNKAEEFKAQNIISVPQSESERGLMLQLAKFNEVIELSFRDRAPHKICEFLYELSNNFNKFYNDTRILSEEDEAKKSSWLSLINLVKNVLEQGLDLLGMESVERM